MTREEEILKEAKAFADGQCEALIKPNDEYAFEQGARWADKHPHWISVEEELPKEWEDKLFVLYTEPLNPDYTYFGRYRIGEFDGDEMTFYLWENHRWKIYGRNDDNTKVTHWMPLPQPPKGGDKE